MGFLIFNFFPLQNSDRLTDMLTMSHSDWGFKINEVLNSNKYRHLSNPTANYLIKIYKFFEGFFCFQYVDHSSHIAPLRCHT